MSRSRITAVLAIAVIVSALSVVHVRHESRRSFVELQALESDRDDLNIDWGRLQIEHATWAEGSRVESMARDELMLEPAQSMEVMVLGQ